ncbi:MAG: hypothetical protein QOE35_2175 [Actinomycetota bacterium]|jgi:hypothetical protein
MQRMLFLVIGICVLTAACGSETKKTATAKPAAAASNAATESAYCDTARQWSVHEIVPVNEDDPVAARKYWGEYTAFNEKASGLAPAAIKDDWNLSVEAINNTLGPVLEKYNFEFARLEKEGSAQEKAIADQPPENVQQAQAAIHRYESDVCAAGQPQPADVDFSGEKKVVAYCDAIAANNDMVNKVFADGAKPADVRKLTTSKEFQAVIEKEHDSAPSAIKADRDVLYSFWKKMQLPLQAKYGYDFRKILLDGPRADRETLQSISPAVHDNYARAAAYEQQVCAQ